jgi:hypothetical protein
MESSLQTAAREASTKLRHLEAEYIATARCAFSVLEKCDPDLAKLSIEALGTRGNASLWFGDRIGSLAGQTPWEALAAGELSQVQWVLNAIIYGLPA